MQADPFSDILKFTRAESLVTGGFRAGGQWAIRFPAPDKIKFFAVVKGRCWVRIEGEPDAVLFGTGDVGLLAAKRASVLASALDIEPVDAMGLFSGAGRSTATLGDGEDFAHLGGHVSCLTRRADACSRASCRRGSTSGRPRLGPRCSDGCWTNSSRSRPIRCPARSW